MNLNIAKLFDQVGSFTPLIMFSLSLYLLWNLENLFFYYVVGVFCNAIVNLILKGIIQQPRPSEDAKVFNIVLIHGKHFLFKDGIPYDNFGMPSGHAQFAFFSTCFIYLSLRKKNIACVYLLLSVLILCHRIAFKYHTIAQVFVGSIVGACFGYFTYYLAREKIKGRITPKLDDFGPI